MKKTKFTVEQIAFALRQAETGTKVKEGHIRSYVLQLEEEIGG